MSAKRKLIGLAAVVGLVVAGTALASTASARVTENNLGEILYSFKTYEAVHVQLTPAQVNGYGAVSVHATMGHDEISMDKGRGLHASIRVRVTPHGPQGGPRVDLILTNAQANAIMFQPGADKSIWFNNAGSVAVLGHFIAWSTQPPWHSPHGN